MSKNLTANEVNGLYYYLQAHGIPYKDIQNEVVDHLATGIEETTLKNETDSFSKQLYDYIDTLPNNFFKDFLIQKRKVLTKLWWTRFKEGFTFNVIIVSIILSTVIHLFIENLIANGFFVYNFFIFLTLQIIIQSFTFYFAYKKSKKVNAEKYLSIMHYTSVTSIIFSIVVNSALILIYITYSKSLNASFSIITLSLLLSSIYIIAFHFPKKLESDLKDIIPQIQKLSILK